VVNDRDSRLVGSWRLVRVEPHATGDEDITMRFMHDGPVISNRRSLAAGLGERLSIIQGQLL
jgi:hypothetical protein